MTSDLVERFLHDAEQAARTGDRRLALDLIVLALDFAQREPAVLIRAQAIRRMLPDWPTHSPARDSADPPARASLEDESRSATIGATAPVAAPSFELPDVDALDIAREPRDFRRVVTVSRRQEDTQADDSARTPLGRRGGLARIARLALLAALLATSGMVVVGTLSPETLNAVVSLTRRYVDPLARAEHAYERGRLDAAYAGARGRVAANDRVGRSLFLLGRVEAARGSTEIAFRAFARALELDDSYLLAMEIGRALQAMAAPDHAADAFLVAFERGAPWEVWVEIADAQLLAGRLNHAKNLYDAIERVAPPSVVVTRPPELDLDEVETEPVPDSAS